MSKNKFIILLEISGEINILIYIKTEENIFFNKSFWLTDFNNTFKDSYAPVPVQLKITFT